MEHTMTLPFVLVPMCLGTHSRISILSSTLTKRDFRFPPSRRCAGCPTARRVTYDRWRIHARGLRAWHRFPQLALKSRLEQGSRYPRALHFLDPKTTPILPSPLFMLPTVGGGAEGATDGEIRSTTQAAKREKETKKGSEDIIQPCQRQLLRRRDLHEDSIRSDFVALRVDLHLRRLIIPLHVLLADLPTPLHSLKPLLQPIRRNDPGFDRDHGNEGDGV